MEAARDHLTNHLLATACKSQALAQQWSASLMSARAAACLVTDDDVTWYKEHVVEQRAARRDGQASAARVVSRAVHHASLLLQRVWSERATRLAALSGQPDRRNESEANRSTRLARERAARLAAATAGPELNLQQRARPGRCPECLLPLMAHRQLECAAYLDAHARLARVLRGDPVSLTPGLAHAAPLS
jgi:hypothetical protein